MIPYSMEYRNRIVVIYARVSTEHETQISALENQLDWYKPMLDYHPEWTLVERSADFYEQRCLLRQRQYSWL